MKSQKAVLLSLMVAAQIGTGTVVQAAPDLDPQLTTGSSKPVEFALYINSNNMEFNGIKYLLSRKTVVKQGVSYVSLRSLAEHLGYTVKYDAQTKETLLASDNTKTSFTLNSHTYQVNGAPRTMRGAPYDDHGVLMIPLTSLTGAFQIPYTLTGNKISLTVSTGASAPDKPNVAPTAYFTTDKDKYRMGEPVTITDQSTDDEDAIVERQWANKQTAFFDPGIVEIKLQVTDKHGLTSVYSKQIEIIADTLYSPEEFAQLYTPIGSNFAVDGKAVLSLQSLPYTYKTEPYTLFRASGPETVNSEGILYQDTIAGSTRFMIHHKNNLSEKAKFYLIAENKNNITANLDIQSVGIAGPTPYPELSGRLAGARYLNSTLTGNDEQRTQLAAGESRVLFDGLSSSSAAPGDVVSMSADLVSDSPIQYTMLMVKASSDPLPLISTLPDLDPEESIVRGTFADSTRVFEYNGLVGEQAERLPLTDNTTDPFGQGRDGLNDRIAINSGNYGVLYKIVLKHVAPNTLIAFNPRGGRYLGSMRVNQNVVDIKQNTDTQNSATALYRAGNTEEEVDLWISPAAGSNLPFTLLFLPLPVIKD